MGNYIYDVPKHNMVNGATVIDTGSAYMFLIPPLYTRIIDIVSIIVFEKNSLSNHGF